MTTFAFAPAARQWLFTAALPLWSSAGLDRDGGFFERLDVTGAPIREGRRLRVAARQVYVFGAALRLGWAGPCEEVIAHGMSHLRRVGLDGDGLLHARIDVDGRIVTPGPDLYDQAFWLLALSEEARVFDAAASEHEALAVLDAMNRRMRHPARGYEESDRRILPLRSNPHMHLLEAAMSWVAVGRSDRWRALGDAIVDLCLERFRDPESGALLEYFDGDWMPARDPERDVVEPGHLFEWSWLLWRWGETTGRDCRSVALGFADLARRHGVDPDRGVAIDGLDTRLRPRARGARLWPQTERMKAAVAHLAMTGDTATAEREATAAWGALRRYFDAAVPGSWVDRMTENGTLIAEPAPASSLYHIVCALAEAM